MPISPTQSDVAGRIRAAVLERGADKTVCPSEIARKLASGGENWRSFMGEVHRAVDDLLAEGAVKLSWKGRPMARREGPYRIGGA